MRTKIKVVGIGNRMSGISKKNGKAYNFFPVSFVYEDPVFPDSVPQLPTLTALCWTLPVWSR